MALLLSWFAYAFAVWLSTALVPGVKVRGDAWSYMVVAAVFATLNLVLHWFLYLVIGFATFFVGFVLSFLTHLVVNALVLRLTSALSSRFDVKDFGSAFFAALIIAGVAAVSEPLIAAILR